MKKVLFSVLLIAMVASMVGAGTWAYFTDYETSRDNYFAAGALDLKVDGEDDPNVIQYFEVECVKPGDFDSVEIVLTNTGCVDGYADLHFMVTVDSDNDLLGEMPEPEDDCCAPNNDTWDGTAGGDLCDVLEITAWVDSNRDGSWDLPPVIDGMTMCSIDCINWDLGALPGTDYMGGGNNWIGLKIQWFVPTTVGNIIMTDLCGFDMEFSLTQLPMVVDYFDLTVTSDGCCPIDVGAPVSQTVAAGASETFLDIMGGVTIKGAAYDDDVCCDFDSWAGDINGAPGDNPNSVTMDADSSVTATCEDATYDLTVDQTTSCCAVDVSGGATGTVAAGTSETFTDITCNAVVDIDADDSVVGCDFSQWTGDIDLGAGVDPNQVTMNADKTVTAECTTVGYDLTVTSDGCCPITVWATDPATVVPAGESQTFFNIVGGSDIMVAAGDGDPCCDFVSWDDGGLQMHTVYMDANKSVTATCVWQTSDLTVDQTASCCDVQVGAPVGQTVAAGTSQTFTDIDCCTDISFTAVNPDPVCCTFVDWSGVDSSTDGTADVHMDGTDKTVSANCNAVGPAALTVNSCGCCDVDVDYDSVWVYTLSPGETWTDPAVPCCTDVTVTAVTPPMCVCDCLEIDDPYCECDCIIPPDYPCPTVQVHMDGNPHSVNVCCHEMTCPVPEPCCWCIYLAEWWEGSDPPVGDPDNVEYFCLHTVEWFAAGHDETLGSPFPGGVHIIPDPSWQQELTAYVGPAPHGYLGMDEWDLLTGDPATAPGVSRYNPTLGPVFATGLGYWNSQIDLLNWKTRFNVRTAIGPITLYACTLQVIPMVGNPGWPFAVGNMWATLGMSSITAPSLTYNVVTGTEMVDCGGYVPPMECFVVESYAWVDANGNNIPDEGELTPGGINYWSNEYGCKIKSDTYPGDLYDGWENICLIWYCFDPPFPPWE